MIPEGYESRGIDASEAKLQNVVFGRQNWTCRCGAKDVWLELCPVSWGLLEHVTDFGPDDLVALCPSCMDKPTEGSNAKP